MDSLKLTCNELNLISSQSYCRNMDFKFVVNFPKLISKMDYLRHYNYVTGRNHDLLHQLAFLTLCDQAFNPPILGGKIIELAKFCFMNKRLETNLSFFR